jgi:hypothetical protein
MAPNLLFYQLLLVALVLLCLMVHVWWPDHPTPTPRTSLKPSTPRRTRSKEPKPFTGYIHKPLCEACKQGVDSRPKAPGSPPPVMLFTRGRRRTVDTSGHFCPDHDCSYHGWLCRGNIRSNGHPGGLCRKIAFSRQNPKIVSWKINDLRVQTFLFSVICDRAQHRPPGR